jgi:hypothetical protein
VINPRGFQTSTVRKSAATRLRQCALRNTDQGVRSPRVGAGSMPSRFRMFAIVPRATLCPRFESAP